MAELMARLEVVKQVAEVVGGLALGGLAYYYGIGYALECARWWSKRSLRHGR